MAKQPKISGDDLDNDPSIPTINEMGELRRAIPDEGFLLLNTAHLTHGGAVIEASVLIGRRAMRCIAILGEAGVSDDEEDSFMLESEDDGWNGLDEVERV